MQNLIPFIFAVATALCWGLYGPILGRARIEDPTQSPFKPYVAIGVAYLVIAVIGGVIGMVLKGDNFNFVSKGSTWGGLAGTLGALGALFLTICMFNGGARIPQAVMPIVFGGAVTVSALYAVFTSASREHASPMLWVGVALMLISTVIITRNTPHAAPAPAKTAQAQQTTVAAASEVSHGS